MFSCESSHTLTSPLPPYIHSYLTQQHIVNTATRTSVLVGDTLAVHLTWIKTYKNVKTFRETKALDLGGASTTLGTGMGGTRRKSVMESIMRGGKCSVQLALQEEVFWDERFIEYCDIYA